MLPGRDQRVGPGRRRRLRLAILGTSLFAPEVADIVEDCGEFEVSVFIENWDRARTAETLLGRPVIWFEDAAPLAATHRALCSLGTTKRRQFIEAAVAMGFRFATVIHPTARVSRRSVVEPGSFISAGVVVSAGTKVGRHVVANRGVLVGHDTVIGDYVTLSPGANIAGAVSVGEGTYVGMGAIVLDRIRVGEGAVIAAGAVVTKDVPDRVEVMGVPARIVKELAEGGR
jgi:sugar O-acyltransferase (sialic acid O-acetyltransferase NeuD family)